jgi:hypothetical protein
MVDIYYKIALFERLGSFWRPLCSLLCLFKGFICNPVVLVRSLAYWLKTTELPRSQIILLLTKPSLCTALRTQILTIQSEKTTQDLSL